MDFSSWCTRSGIFGPLGATPIIKPTAELLNHLPPEQKGLGNGGKVALYDLKKEAGTYSKKVFLGGLPPDVDEDELKACFGAFGSMEVDWPGKSNTNYMFPPKGFAFIVYNNELSVHQLLQSCWQGGGGFYFPVSSLSISNKLVEVRPWKVADSAAVLDKNFYLKKQYAVFVGGVPRPVTAAALAQAISVKFGNLGYTVISLDPKTNYPKGTATLLFTNFGSFASALVQKHVLLALPGHSPKIIEFKPFQNPTQPLMPTDSSLQLHENCLDPMLLIGDTFQKMQNEGWSQSVNL